MNVILLIAAYLAIGWVVATVCAYIGFFGEGEEVGDSLFAMAIWPAIVFIPIMVSASHLVREAAIKSAPVFTHIDPSRAAKALREAQERRKIERERRARVIITGPKTED